MIVLLIAKIAFLYPGPFIKYPLIKDRVITMKKRLNVLRMDLAILWFEGKPYTLSYPFKNCTTFWTGVAYEFGFMQHLIGNAGFFTCSGGEEVSLVPQERNIRDESSLRILLAGHNSSRSYNR